MTLALKTSRPKFTKVDGNIGFFISEYMINRIKRNGGTFRIIHTSKELNTALGTYTILKVNKDNIIQANTIRDTYYECVLKTVI